jgi:hypothetical protein
MAVHGSYIASRIRVEVLPFVKVYGQWVEERIIPLASQLGAMADAVKKQAYREQMSQPVGEDNIGDGYEAAEYAFDVGFAFYGNITGVYQGTLNLFAAGLFHLLEQQLAAMTRGRGRRNRNIAASDTQLEKVIHWYQQHFHLDLKQFPSWSLIEELRLVANTTKHAEGSAATKLRSIHHELFQNPDNIPVFDRPVHLPLGGDGLYVTADDFRNYHKAALDLFDWLVESFENHADQSYPQ